jgi:hypothetical protein
MMRRARLPHRRVIWSHFGPTDSMATTNGPGIDGAFRNANREQDIALSSLDRVHRASGRVADGRRPRFYDGSRRSQRHKTGWRRAASESEGLVGGPAYVANNRAQSRSADLAGPLGYFIGHWRRSARPARRESIPRRRCVRNKIGAPVGWLAALTHKDTKERLRRGASSGAVRRNGDGL